MRHGLVMVFKIPRQDAAQVMLVKDDDVIQTFAVIQMIQTFAADRADEVLDIWILPGWAALDHPDDRLALPSSSLQGRPGALPSRRPSGPRALKRNTQSRMIWRPTPPIFAASVRVALS